MKILIENRFTREEYYVKSIDCEKNEITVEGSDAVIAIYEVNNPWEIRFEEIECLHPEIINSHGYPKCSVCDDKFDGWYCPSSPDHFCHYDSWTEDGINHYIYISEGDEFEQFQLPEDHDPCEGSEDDCIFCGQPEERK